MTDPDIQAAINMCRQGHFPTDPTTYRAGKILAAFTYLLNTAIHDLAMNRGTHPETEWAALAKQFEHNTHNPSPR